MIPNCYMNLHAKLKDNSINMLKFTIKAIVSILAVRTEEPNLNIEKIRV